MLEVLYADEHQKRKRLHNQLQDLKGTIRVFCRTRPLVERETGEEIAIDKQDEFTVELKRTRRDRALQKYSFDSIFGPEATQEEVFEECRNLVTSAIDGYNVTIFAYGQTGAGKTHTMYGSDASPGLTPRTMAELFDAATRLEGKQKLVFKMVLFECYRDELIDLLSTEKKPPSLQVKKDSSGMVYVENSVQKEVSSLKDMKDTLAKGFAKRKVSATKMNADSSRSHLMFSILIEAHDVTTKKAALGKITLCDLAGSERVKKSGATGDVLKEAQAINKSLTALGDVIEALTKEAAHVPYRNHKLTMLMMDSLGGNAKTLMFVNVSPALSNSEETASSLSYAVRAKTIQNTVKKTEESSEVRRLKTVIASMSAELARLKPLHGSGVEAPTIHD